MVLVLSYFMTAFKVARESVPEGKRVRLGGK